MKAAWTANSKGNQKAARITMAACSALKSGSTTEGRMAILTGLQMETMKSTDLMSGGKMGTSMGHSMAASKERTRVPLKAMSREAK